MNCGSYDGACGDAGAIGWIIQACWCNQQNVEEKTCNGSTERCAPYYKAALSFQGEESVAEMADHCHEEIRLDGDARRLFDRMR